MSGFGTATNHLLPKSEKAARAANADNAANAAKLGNVPAASYRRHDGGYRNKLPMGSEDPGNWDGITYSETYDRFEFWADQNPNSDVPIFAISDNGLISYRGNRVTHAGQNVGEVGTYAMLMYESEAIKNPGSGLSGSVLKYANAHGTFYHVRPSGVWRLMAYLSGSSDTEGRTGLFLRYA